MHRHHLFRAQNGQKAHKGNNYLPINQIILDSDAAGGGAGAEDVDAARGDAEAVKAGLDGFLRYELPED